MVLLGASAGYELTGIGSLDALGTLGIAWFAQGGQTPPVTTEVRLQAAWPALAAFATEKKLRLGSPGVSSDGLGGTWMRALASAFCVAVESKRVG